jgi:hypothetical protein
LVIFSCSSGRGTSGYGGLDFGVCLEITYIISFFPLQLAEALFLIFPSSVHFSFVSFGLRQRKKTLQKVIWEREIGEEEDERDAGERKKKTKKNVWWEEEREKSNFFLKLK